MSMNPIEPETHVIEIIAGSRKGRVVKGFQPVNRGDEVTFNAVNTAVTLLFFQGSPFQDGRVERIELRGTELASYFIEANGEIKLKVEDDTTTPVEIYPYKAFCHSIKQFAEAGSDPEILVRGGP